MLLSYLLLLQAYDDLLAKRASEEIKAKNAINDLATKAQEYVDAKRMVQFTSILSILSTGRPMTQYTELEPLYKLLKVCFSYVPYCCTT